MDNNNLISFIRSGELFAHCKEYMLFDSIIGSFPQTNTPTSTIIPRLISYHELGWDFSISGPLARLLTQNDRRLLLSCDEFSINELHELLPIIAQRTAPTIIINLGSGVSGLFIKGTAEINDIDLILDNGIQCCEPADTKSFFKMLTHTSPTYIRIADKELPQSLYEDTPTPYLFSATAETIADPSFTLLCGGYLFHEALGFAQRAEELGQKPAVFCFQNYSEALSPELIQTLERSDRCVILLDQAQTTGFGEYIASKLPPHIAKELSFHFITPDTQHITTRYSELAYEQAGLSI